MAIVEALIINNDNNNIITIITDINIRNPLLKSLLGHLYIGFGLPPFILLFYN